LEQAAAENALKACVEQVASVRSVLRNNDTAFPASPEKGESGSGPSIVDLGVLTLDEKGSRRNANGLMTFREGEFVAVTGVNEARPLLGGPPDFVAIDLTSLLKHNVTRGKGAFEHQSPEFLRSQLKLPLGMSCETFQEVWSRLFSSVEKAEVDQLFSRYPSGVLVDELREGMTVEEVEAMMGPPENKAVLGEKVVYFYPRMKITFLKGRLADVQ